MTVLFIQFFWIEARFRGKGHGTALIEKIEEEARRFGAVRSYLDTMSFQAPGFYRACGYEPFGALDDYPGWRDAALVHQGAVRAGDDDLESKIPHRIEGSADRAVQARGHRLPARDRQEAGARSDVRRRAAGSGAGQGAAAGAGAQDDAGAMPPSCAATPIRSR